MNYEALMQAMNSGNTERALNAVDYFYANMVAFTTEQVDNLVVASERVIQQADFIDYRDHYKRVDIKP